MDDPAVHYPVPSLPRTSLRRLHRIRRAPPRPEPMAAPAESPFPDRRHGHQRHPLDEPVQHRWNPQRPCAPVRPRCPYPHHPGRPDPVLIDLPHNQHLDWPVRWHEFQTKLIGQLESRLRVRQIA